MARSNDAAKKVRKVARSGRGRRRRGVRERRSLAYPSVIAAVIILGTLLVIFARSQRDVSANEAPKLNFAASDGTQVAGDHWHAAYGIWVCTEGESGGFLPNQTDSLGDRLGIHTHEDGFIHIHPFDPSATGRRAVLGLFFDEVGIDSSDSAIELSDGERWENGDECPDPSDPAKTVDGEWRVAKWDSLTDEDPEIFEAGFSRIRFTGDGEMFTIFFGDPDAEIPPPPSAPDQPQQDLTGVPVDDNGDGKQDEDETVDIPDIGDVDTSAPDSTAATDASTPDTSAPATTAVDDAADTSAPATTAAEGG